ncbi:MAG: hypothetical protein HQK87_10355 [Nitrospinae bacterium]|nr:hypothetical protein [Nitrospinota bacterium]
MNRYSFLARFKEPSTWAALAAGLAIVTGHDPTLAADTALQIAGGVATLAGVVLAESNNRNPPLL